MWGSVQRCGGSVQRCGVVFKDVGVVFKDVGVLFGRLLTYSTQLNYVGNCCLLCTFDNIDYCVVTSTLLHVQPIPTVPEDLVIIHHTVCYHLDFLCKF